MAKFKSFDNNQEKEIKQSNQIKQPNQINQLNQSLNQSNIFNNSQIKGSNNNYQYPELYKTHHTNNQNQQNQLDFNNRNQYPINSSNHQSSKISLDISNSSYISSKSASFFILNQYSTALNIIKQDHPLLYQDLQQKSNNQADIIIKKFQQSFDLQKNKITSQELEKLQQESNLKIKQLTNIDKIFGIKSLDNFKQSESYNNLKTESLQQANNLNDKA